ncbi:hypothetical protein LOK49_LG02G00080 [Camellia lanceoleosa]|uniref:Uncharacterized protein n=1 Tax=Camellia lanceoleosa TaxID=1840588 RepID=A0ACC0IR80_9ERIC|nr:hypothetical protein LOK49_LG02G00080 [Camellia lanceoleosa]
MLVDTRYKLPRLNGATLGVGAQHSQVFIRFKYGMALALVEREGKDVTITTFSRMVGYAIKIYNLMLLIPWEDSAFAHEVVLIINLRSIRPLDRAIINASVRNTSRLVTIEEGFPQHGVGAEIWCCITYLCAIVLWSGKAFSTKGMQVLELVGKETIDLLITETGIEVDKKGAQAQDDEDQFSNFEIDGSATASEKGKKIKTRVAGSADEMKNLHNSSVKKAAEMAAGPKLFNVVDHVILPNGNGLKC